jgi:hypothetical protein
VWRLADQPEFSLSDVAGDPPFPLFQAFNGAIAEDGTLIVGNRGDQRLVYLDPGGHALRVVGGEGQGPGEFGSMGDIFAAADGVWVWDARLRGRPGRPVRTALARALPVQGPGHADLSGHRHVG